jgi:sialate O-acetylesterase
MEKYITQEHKIFAALVLLIVTFGSSSLYGNEWEKILNLKGRWRFTIGDDKKWADPKLNDKDWEEIKVPSAWENEGFYGYDGYAWYRKHFYCSEEFNRSGLYLQLGYIDDVDEVYINGVLVGFSGTFPPDYNTAYNAFRKYSVPVNLLRFNQDNVIAVRVYDSQQAGGITGGDIGFFAKSSGLIPNISLEGEWKFNTGNNSQWLKKDFDDSNWSRIFVPSYWETQGFVDYNGFAWYRKSFKLNQSVVNKKYVLLMGKIDDLDEVYVNGKLIGSTGKMKSEDENIQFSNEWQVFRGYYLPENLLVAGENVIAVKVYDGYINGGIYEGPIGLITQEKYASYWKSQKKKKNFFDYFFGNN